MANVMRHTFPGLLDLCNAHNALKSQIGYGAFFHLDISEVTVTVANGSDLPTCLALGNNLIGVCRFHFADTLSLKIADVTALPALGACLDLATSITAMTLLKATWATHIASTSVHGNADGTNTLLTATPTDLPSLITFMNAAKTAVNAHLANGQPAAALRLVSA